MPLHACGLARRIPTKHLQALVTLNDPVYQEAAEALARRNAGESTSNRHHHPGELLDAR